VQTLDLVDADSGVDFGNGVYLDTRAAGSGDRVALLLPGAERAVENATFVESLAEEFSVVVPSHPGFGRSARPDWCTTVADLADIYVDWLERSEASDVTLVGLQFGGWIALEIAVRRPAQLARLVLVDAVGVKLGGPLDRDFADIFATPYADLEKLYYADAGFGLGDLGSAREDDVLEMARNDEALVLYGWEPYLHDPRLGRAIERIDVPTLLIWGSHDGIVSPDHGRGLAAKIAGARFEDIDGAGHRPQVERAEAVARLITTFAG
jgi:pimeloyl-ACP methyl ester carboxylesterase